jgi:hypothetical protein
MRDVSTAALVNIASHHLACVAAILGGHDHECVRVAASSQT